MLRTGRRSADVWQSLLPAEALMMPAELVRVDALLDDVEKVRHYEGFVLMSPTPAKARDIGHTGPDAPGDAASVSI
jgi:hypothetical protein